MPHARSISVIPVGHSGVRLHAIEFAHAAARALRAIGYRLLAR